MGKTLLVSDSLRLGSAPLAPLLSHCLGSESECFVRDVIVFFLGS